MSRITKKQRALIQNTLKNAAEAVTEIPNSALAEFIPQLERARAQVLRELKEWAIKEESGARYTAHKFRSVLVQLENSIEAIRGLGDAMEEVLITSGTRAAEAGVAAMESQLIAMDSMFTGAVIPISIDRAEVLASGRKLLLRRYKTSAARYSGGIEKAVRNRLASGVLRQQSIEEVTVGMIRSIPEVFNMERFNAHRLVRTEVMHSYNTHHHEALLDAYSEDSDVLMRWDASYDHRRCPECASLDGMIVAVDSKFDSHWVTDGGDDRFRSHIRPPAHPQCRCVLVPWMEDWPDTGSIWPDDPPKSDNKLKA